MADFTTQGILIDNYFYHTDGYPKRIATKYELETISRYPISMNTEEITDVFGMPHNWELILAFSEESLDEYRDITINGKDYHLFFRDKNKPSQYAYGILNKVDDNCEFLYDELDLNIVDSSSTKYRECKLIGCENISSMFTVNTEEHLEGEIPIENLFITKLRYKDFQRYMRNFYNFGANEFVSEIFYKNDNFDIEKVLGLQAECINVKNK